MPPSSSDSWFANELQPHDSALRAWLRRSFPKLTEIDDLVQEAYVRVLQARNQTAIASPKAFLFTTAHNLAIDQLRHRRVARTEAIAEIDELRVDNDKPAIPDAVGVKLDLELLTEALQSLPPRCREVLALRKIHGLSQREVAARLGISEHTVEVQVAKGMHRCTEFFRRRGVLRERKGES